MTQTVKVSVLCKATIRGRFGDVKELAQVVMAEALRQTEGGIGHIQPKEFRELFGYSLGETGRP